MGKETDRIFQEIKNGVADEKTVPFIDKPDVLREIRADMEAKFPSLNKFADCCCLSASQLCEFYKGTKNMGRDNLLSIFISLNYDLDKIQTMLQRLNAPSIYVKNKRDYLIAVGIREKKPLDEIDSLLISGGFEPLLNDSKNNEN